MRLTVRQTGLRADTLWNPNGLTAQKSLLSGDIGSNCCHKNLNLEADGKKRNQARPCTHCTLVFLVQHGQCFESWKRGAK